ncbi:hypothetical protein ACTM9O_25980 [Citrobacter freundii]|uniref:hypothetical protein n=1 Tax=Citrobacter freundii TaxID=546 RepID=UPI00374F9F5F
MTLIQEKLEPLSFFDQLVIELHHKLCRHEWCDHFHIIYTGEDGFHTGFAQKFCPKCGKVEA